MPDHILLKPGKLTPDEWQEMKKRCQSLLNQEEKLREVAEIVGSEGLQDSDHLLMYVAEQIRHRFLSQNSFTEDAFFLPRETYALIENLVAMYDRSLERIQQGESLAVILQELSQ